MFGVASTVAGTTLPLQQTLTDTASALTLTDGSHRIETKAAAANFAGRDSVAATSRKTAHLITLSGLNLKANKKQTGSIL
jgi:hypothetical protein